VIRNMRFTLVHIVGRRDIRKIELFF
jgi:hypothetical protein